MVHKSASANGKNHINFGIGFSIDQASYNKTLQSLKKLQNITQNDISGKTFGSKDMQSQIDRIKKSASDVQKIWKKAFNSDLGTLNIQKFNSLLNSSGINLKKLGKDWASTGATGASALRNITTATLTANMNLKKTDGLINKMGTTFLNTIKWTFASSVINNFTGSLQQSFGYIKSLDSSLNDIRIVTGKSAEEMDKFAVKANDAAKALGKQTTDYTNAALIYYQQGLNEQESNTLAETTLKVSNITGQSAKTVSEEITAVMNGYQLGADQVERAFDSLAAVAATTASDLSEISTGMSKVASTANMLGVPLDSLNAQLATIVSVTRQAPESVGTALKTIYARMNDLKLGKSDEDGIQLGDVSGSLEKMGIHILDEKKNLRDLGTVINEVAASWKTWTDEQRIAMAESLAGKRQYNNLIALFDNWDMYTKALNTSLTAQGTIAKQNGIYLDSLAAHMNQLKAAQEGVMDSFFDSKSFKGFIDFGTSALNVLEKIIDTLGGGGTIIANLAAILGRVFNKQISREISNIVINLQNYKYNLQQVQSASEALKNIKEINLGFGDEGVKQIVKYKEQIAAMGNIVTPEQQNQANAILEKVSVIYNERDAWKQNYNAVSQYLAVSENVKTADDLLKNSEEDLQKEIGETTGKIEEKLKNYKSYIKQVSSLISKNTAEKEKKDGQQNWEITKEKNYSLFQEVSKYESDARIIKEVFNNNKEAAEQFFRAVKDGSIKGESQIKKLYEILVKNNKGFLTAKNVISNAINYCDEKFATSIKNTQLQWNQFINSLSVTHIVNQIVTLTSSIGQMAAGCNTITNLVNVMSNESIPFAQRIQQLITNLAFSIPQVVSGIKGMKTALVALGVVKLPQFDKIYDMILGNKGYKKVKGLSLEKDDLKVFDNDDKRKFSSLLNSKNKKISEKAERIRQALINNGIQLTGEETSAEVKNKAAKLASSKATEALSKSQKLLNGVMTVAPMAIMAVVTVLSMMAQAQEKAKQKELEVAQKQLETRQKVLDKKREQAQKIEELATSYHKLYDQYKNNQISLENLHNSTYELCKEYGDYDLIVKALAGSYDELNEAMRETQRLANEGIIQSAERLKNQVKSTLGKESGKVKSSHSILTALAGGGAGIPLINATDIWKTNAFTAFEKTNGGGWKKNLEFEKKLQELTGGIRKGGMLDITANMDKLADNWQDIQKLIGEYADELSSDYDWQVSQETLDAITDDIDKFKQAKDSAKQAKLKNILTSNKSFQNKNNITDRKTFDTYFEGITNDAKGLFKTEKQAKDWALKSLLDETDSTVRKYGFITNIEDKIGNVSEETKKALDEYLESLSEEDLQLIISGEIEVLGKKGPNALKQGLQILKRQVTPEDTKVAMQVRAEVAKGGQLKKDDIKNLSIQSGVNIDTISDSLDSGSILDKLERYEGIISKINEENKEYLNVSVSEAATKFTENEKKLKELKDEQEKLVTEVAKSGGANTQAVIDLDAINKQIAAYETLQNRLQKIKDGLSIEDIDTATFDIIRNEIDSVVTKAETLKSAAEMIGEGFKIAAGDVKEFAELYPELLEGAQIWADGTMQLDDQTVQHFMETKQQQIESDTKAKEEKLDAQITIYKARVKFDKAKIAALQEYLTTDMDAKALQTKLEGAYGQYVQDVIDTTGVSQKELADNGLSNTQILGDESSKIIDDLGRKWSDLNRYISLAVVGKAPGSFSSSGIVKINTTGQEFARTKSVENVRDKNPEEYDKAYKKLQEAYKELEADQDHLNELNSLKFNIRATANASIASMKGAASGTGGKASSGGGSSKDPETKDHKDYSDKAIKDERDIYLEINRIIQDTQKKLEKLEKTTEKLVGEDLAKALQEQNKILAQQSANYEKKAEIAKKEQERLAKELEQKGFTFGENGELNNYNAAYTANADRINRQIQAIQDETNAAIDTYNSLSAAAQQEQKEALEALIKDADARVQALNQEWSALTDNVSKYNDAIDDVEENEKLAQQALEKQYENMVTLFEKKIKVTLDFNDAKREYQKFVKDVVKNFSKETAKGLGVMLDTSAAELETYLNKDNGDAITYQNQLNTATDALERMKANGTDRDQVTGFTQKEAVQKAQEASKGLMSSLTSAKDKIQELYDAWLEGYDKIQEQFSKQVKKYQFINNLLDHDVKLVNLLYGDKAYDLLDKYYNKQIQNDNKKLELLKEQASFNEKNMLAIQKQLEGLQEGTKEYEQAERRYEATQNAWMESINNLNSAIEDSLNRIIEKYNNAWNQAIDKSIKELTDGRSLENIAEEWQLIKKNADMYYDDINKGFEIEKTALAYDKAISGLQGNIDAQKRLNALKEQEINKLKQKEKITKYDVERANALLDLEQKKIALEEAQKNKSKLRLRRDSQGNYSYQYTTDEQDTENKQSDYLNSMQNVYNLDRQAYRDNLDAQLQATTEYFNKKRELAEAYRQGDESALERMKYLDEQYQTYITNLAEENTGIRINLLESTGESAEAVYDDEKASFKSMAESDRQQLMTVLVPGWTGAIQAIDDKVNNSETGFIPTATKLTNELIGVTDTYTIDLDKLQDQAGVTFPAVDEGVGQVSETTQGLVKQTETFIKDTGDLLIKVTEEKGKLDELKNAADGYTQSLRDMVDPADTAITKWKDLQQGIVDATNAASLAIQTIGNAAVSAANEIASVSAAAAVARSNSNSGGGDGGGSGPGEYNNGSPSEYDSGPTPASVEDDPQGAANSVGIFVNGHLIDMEGYTIPQISVSPYAPAGEQEAARRRAKDAARMHAIQVLRNRNPGYSFDTGGYTGKWVNGDTDGRVALLHQKELVLNAEDTKNILSAVDIVRTMRDALNFITSDSSLPNFAKNLASTSSSSQLEQNVHITATFPNVVDRNEIQIALENLTSKASQYINRH